MNYTELKTAVEDAVENTFTATDFATMTKLAEQRIYNSVQLPNLRKTITLTLAQYIQDVTLPSDFLAFYSFAVVTPSRDYVFLLDKDVNFIRESFPNAATFGVPKYYALNGTVQTEVNNSAVPTGISQAVVGIPAAATLFITNTVDGIRSVGDINDDGNVTLLDSIAYSNYNTLPSANPDAYNTYIATVMNPYMEANPVAYAAYLTTGDNLRQRVLIAPAPSTTLSAELNYFYYPESIVTANTTWLGDNFDSVLFNAVMVEAARWMKQEQDIVAMMDKEYMQSMALLKNLGDAKNRTDAYRGGQPRLPVA